MTVIDSRRASRAAFITGAVAAGTGAALAGTREIASAARTGDEAAQGACADTVKSILDAALLAERLSITFYYMGLTSPAVLRNSQLGGASSDPNNPGLPPNGNPHHVRFLQAALDAEVKHAALLVAAGASSPYTQFYFPPNAFARMGSSVDADSFLGLVERLESISVAMYIGATGQFLRLGRRDLAALATQIMGVEAEHRTLGRIIGAILPPNNLTLESAGLACVGDASAVLQPFLTGKRYLFASDASGASPLPTAAQTGRVIGKYGTRRLTRFL